jgi:hypothetical protein
VAKVTEPNIKYRSGQSADLLSELIPAWVDLPPEDQPKRVAPPGKTQAPSDYYEIDFFGEKITVRAAHVGAYGHALFSEGLGNREFAVDVCPENEANGCQQSGCKTTNERRAKTLGCAHKCCSVCLVGPSGCTRCTLPTVGLLLVKLREKRAFAKKKKFTKEQLAMSEQYLTVRVQPRQVFVAAQQVATGGLAALRARIRNRSGSSGAGGGGEMVMDVQLDAGAAGSSCAGWILPESNWFEDGFVFKHSEAGAVVTQVQDGGPAGAVRTRHSTGLQVGNVLTSIAHDLNLVGLDKPDFDAVWVTWASDESNHANLRVVIDDFDIITIPGDVSAEVSDQGVTAEEIEELAQDKVLGSAVDKWVATMNTAKCEQDTCAADAKQSVAERTCGHYSCIDCWEAQCTACMEEEEDFCRSGAADDADDCVAAKNTCLRWTQQSCERSLPKRKKRCL